MNFWTARSRPQRLAVLAGFALSLLAVLAVVALAGRTPMALLYSGLEDAKAAPILRHLEQAGVSHEIRGSSIWVDAAQRDRMRMDLAGQNLPEPSSAGYEILDEISGFSTTSQMFDAAFWRAKEGELARTILSLPNIRSARVHLTAPRSRGYQALQAGSASVTVVTDGAPVSLGQASALRFLIASAVPELTPEGVAVIDSERGLVQTGEAQGAEDRQSRLRERVERILQPHVGLGNAIVELAVDYVTETEQLTERSFDPAQRALISEEVEELTDESSTAGKPAVTAASNLPDQPNATGAEQQAQRAETRQRANYEVGSVTRLVERQPGGIRRLTVAVLVNGIGVTGPDGTTTMQPRPEPELAAIRDLVAAAVGFDEARGDQITVRSLPFAELSQDGTLADGSRSLADRLMVDSLARLALIGVIALAALAMAIRAIRPRALPSAPGAAALDDTAPGLPALPQPSPEPVASGATDVPLLPMAAGPMDYHATLQGDVDHVARLRRLMRERQEESVRLLSGWIDEQQKVG